jgi:outer membrane protein assembly factor BamB/serine/threonine protein kinase
MGAVYLAREESQDRTIALKVLSDDLRDNEGFMLRFLQEAHTLRQVEHPNVIPVYSAGNADGVLYIATRFVPGGDLAGVLAGNGGRLTAAHVAEVIRQVAGALDAAHGKRLVHRDVKPGNILVDTTVPPHGHAYLSDFGLIRDNAASDRMTTKGVGLGTPAYCAPEQVEGRDVDGRADQYSLACVAFQLLTGQVPYPGRYGALAFAAHVNEPVPSAALANPAVQLPPAADQVLRRAMAKDPAQRYASCSQFASALSAALASPVHVPVRSQGTAWVPGAPGYTPTQAADRSSAGPPPDYRSAGRPGSGSTWAPQAPPSLPRTQTRVPPPFRPGTTAQLSSGATARLPRPRRGARLVAVGVAAVVVLAAVIYAAPKAGHLFGAGNSPGTGSSASGGTASGKASLRWSYTTGINLDANQQGATSSSPAVAGGTVYVGGDNGDVYAFNAASGHLDWHTVTASAQSGPTVADGTLYVGSAGGMYAMDAATGHVRWSYGGGSAESTPVVVNGTVYIVGRDGEVHALNAANGQVRWSHSVTYAGTGLAVANGLVYVGTISDTGYVYALDSATGDLKWSFKTLQARESTPVVADGTVYVGCGNGPGSNGRVFAINAANGQSRWSYTTGNGTPFGAGGGVESSPVVAGNVVYVGSDNGTVYALDTASGHPVWSYTTPTGSSVVSRPALDGGTVYFGSEDGRIYALSMAAGHLVWSYPTGNLVVSNPAAAGGIVYTASDDGKLYALATVK